MQTDSFSSLGLAPAVVDAVRTIGYELPSPIQARCIPPLLAGRNLLGTAQTGTGKTAAFALPALSRLRLDGPLPQVLVLTPTRELAIQVAEAFNQYASRLPGFHVLPIYGGQEFRVQLKGLKRGAHVVVGTPGRVLDHLRRRTLNLANLSTLVLDEADEMLRMGFIDDVETILAACPENCQRALFSATMPPAIRKVTERYLPDPEQISVARTTATVDLTEQFALPVFAERKLEVLTRILEVEEIDAGIIFVRTKAETLELAEKLSARGHAVAPLNGDLNQRQREQNVEALRTGKLDLVVATDVAARGLDVPRITHVINYDVPYDQEAYVHRIGRTGRAGREGRAILLVTPREQSWLKTLERASGSPMRPYQMPSPQAMQKLRLEQFEQQLLSFSQSRDQADLAALLDDIAERRQLPVAELAAGLAAWLDALQPGVIPHKTPEHLPMPSPRAGRGGPRPQRPAGTKRFKSERPRKDKESRRPRTTKPKAGGKRKPSRRP